jgi:hypothetical protein
MHNLCISTYRKNGRYPFAFLIKAVTFALIVLANGNLSQGCRYIRWCKIGFYTVKATINDR